MKRIAAGAERALDTQMAELGFAPVPDRRGWQRGDATLVRDGAWHRLTVTEPPVAGPLDPLWDQMGRPGLWRVIRPGHVGRSGRTDRTDRTDRTGTEGTEGAENGGLLRVCDLPPGLHGQPELVDCLTWLLATAAGEPPPGWVPPPVEEFEAQLDPERLVVSSGSLTVRGSLIHQPSRLALVFPLRPTLPEEMPPARLSWLREILHDAQTRWRLVRLGFDQRGGGVQAEVDLTGVSGALVSPMVGAALEALRCVVGWVLAPVAVATDLRLQSRLLARGPVPTRNSTRASETKETTTTEETVSEETITEQTVAEQTTAEETVAEEAITKETKKGVVATPSPAGSPQEAGSRKSMAEAHG